LLDGCEAQPGELGDLGIGELAAKAERDQLAPAELLEGIGEIRGAAIPSVIPLEKPPRSARSRDNDRAGIRQEGNNPSPPRTDLIATRRQSHK
jgi:hypothetical protein